MDDGGEVGGEGVQRSQSGAGVFVVVTEPETLRGIGRPTRDGITRTACVGEESREGRLAR